MSHPMHCAYCVGRCEWPKDFPNPTYEICLGCYAEWSRPRTSLWERFIEWLTR